MMQIAKAVFPAAGLGTRFLPATKAQPKEMLPLVDKPLIQYVIEEAVARPDELHAQLRVRVEGVGSAHHVVDLYPFLVHIGQARVGIIVIPPLSRELTHIRPG